MKKTTILIADDHPLVRQAIKNIFRKNSYISFLGEANNGCELMELIKESIPDIVIVDLEMPEMNGYDTILEIHTKYPAVKIIAFSGFLDSVNQQRAIKMGASATICKTESTDVFITAFEAIIEGENFHSNASSDIYIKSLKDYNYSLLTPREKQVLNLIAEGKTSKQISNIYNISQWTVDKHRSNIQEKLEVKTLAEMIRYAIRRSEIIELK